jgi:mannitol operon transcriptional antiterminator
MAEKGRKGRNSLSSRQREIIKILIEMESETTTVAAVSERLGVSSRTVLREMPVIEQWLLENDFHFSRKHGVGLSIQETPEHLELIRELLELEGVRHMYSRDERKRWILGELFFADGPIKAFAFTSRFDISEGTLYSDLDSLDEWLSEYDVSIVRKPGLGIYLEGEELYMRQAIANAVIAFCEMDRITEKIAGAESLEGLSSGGNPLLTFMRPEIVSFARDEVRRCEERLNVHYMDSSELNLIIRMSLAIYRMQKGSFLTKLPAEKGRIGALAELSVSRDVAASIRKNFDLQVTEPEIGRMAMQLSSTRFWSDVSEFNDPMQTMNIRRITLSMIGIAEQMTEIPFHSDDILIEDLVKHLTVMVRRFAMDVLEENVQAEAVRERYPDIYKAAAVACQVLQELGLPGQVRDSDIGYVAMHFAASAERIQENEQKIVAAVVCPTGISSSRMLAAGLGKSFPGIEIRRVLSAFNIDARALWEEGIDLIISTVDLKTDFPWMRVSQILQAQDMMRIRNEIVRINRERIRQRTQTVGSRREGNLRIRDIRRLTDLGIEITQILDHFLLVSAAAESTGELMELAALSVAETSQAADAVRRGFREREERASTYVGEMRICLYHCRTRALEHSRVSYLRLSSPLKTEEGTIEGALVMAVPDGLKDYQTEPVGRISALLVEEERFLKALKAGDEKESISLVETALEKYYQGYLSNKKTFNH